MAHCAKNGERVQCLVMRAYWNEYFTDDRCKKIFLSLNKDIRYQFLLKINHLAIVTFWDFL